MSRTAIYLCNCNGEISKKVDFEQIRRFFQNVKEFQMLCTPDALDFLSKDLSAYDKVIFAACTPKRIESSFRDVARKAGLNPFMIHIVNLREQCAWVSYSVESATKKAISMIQGALKRIEFSEPLKEKFIDLNTDVAVIGAGITGIFAALALSEDENRKVYLIEKNPFIGGKTISYEELFPDFVCAQCLLSESLQEVIDRNNIILLTGSVPENLKGIPGNFQLRIKKRPRYVDVEKCIGCGECIESCPVKIPNEYEFGMVERGAIFYPYPGVLPNAPVIDAKSCVHNEGCNECESTCIFDAINFDEKEEELDIECGAVILATGFSTYPELSEKNVLTSPKFERMLSREGSTGGKILLENGEEPESIAIIHCMGRKELGYCSKICCSIALKYSHIIHRKIPECRIHHIYTDIVLPPFYWRLYEEAKEFAEFHKNDGDVEIILGDRVVLKFGERKDRVLEVDMSVLMCGIKPPNGMEKIAEVFNLDLNEFGFVEVNSKLNPFEALPGIFVAGGISQPVSVEEAIQHAYGCTGRVLSVLSKDKKLKVEAETCIIDESKCSGCEFCVPLCPYGAILRDGGKIRIEDVYCRGCGICASSCPSGAIKARNYTQEQIFAEIEGLIK